jgi:hypothetical protein
MACLATMVLMVAAELTPAAGAVVPVCDTEAPRFSRPLCAERIAAELGGIVDLAVTDSGDIHVLGEDGTITALRPGEELEVERFEIPGALMLTAGYRSLLVATPEGVSRHRIARGELVADVEGRPVVTDRPSALALARIGRLFVAVSTPDCVGGCDDVRVFDALETSPSTGRSIQRTEGDVRRLAVLPGGDVVFGLSVSAGGETELMAIGDHHGGCATDECVAVAVPTSDDPSGMAMAGDQLLARGHPAALVAAGPQLWSVMIEDGVPGSVELLTDSAGAAFRVTSGPDGEVYLSDASLGVVWRLWSRP